MFFENIKKNTGYNIQWEEARVKCSLTGVFPILYKGDTAMYKSEIPLGLMQELVKDKRAMQNYASLSEQEKSVILLKARLAQSKDDMRVIAMSLSDKISAREYL